MTAKDASIFSDSTFRNSVGEVASPTVDRRNDERKLDDIYLAENFVPSPGTEAFSRVNPRFAAFVFSFMVPSCEFFSLCQYQKKNVEIRERVNLGGMQMYRKRTVND